METKISLETFQALQTWENPNVDNDMVREIMEDCHGDESHTKGEWYSIYHAICRASR